MWIAKRSGAGGGGRGRVKKLPKRKEVQFAVCLDSAIKQSRGRKWTDDSLEESGRKLRKSKWIEWVIEWANQREEPLPADASTEPSPKIREIVEQHVDLCFFEWSQQCHSKYAITQWQFLYPRPSISTFAVVHTSVQFSRLIYCLSSSTLAPPALHP